MGTTAVRKLPYPEPTGRVMDGDDAIKSLAQALEAGAAVFGSNATLETGTQSVWTTDTNPATVTFVAPASGRVKVTLSAYIVNTAAAGNTGNAFSGLKWSGAVTRDPSNGERVGARASATGGTWSRTFLVTGLTPGATHTLTSAHMCDSGASWYSTDRAVLVEGA